MTNKHPEKNWKKIALAMVFSLAVSFAFEYGQRLSYGGGLSVGGLNIFNMIIYFFVAFPLTIVAFNKLESRQENIGRKHEKAKFDKKRWIIFSIIIFACYVPIFLAFFPGIFEYDVTTQLGGNTTQHPLLHTWFLKLFVNFIGKVIFGNRNIGIALATLVQMGVVSVTFSYVLEKVRQISKNKVLYWLLFVFFAFSPMNSIMAISMTKDTIFAMVFMLAVMHIFDVILADKLKIKELVPFITFSALAILLRNNMMYVFVAWMVLALILVGRHNKKIVLVTGAVTLVIAFIVNDAITAITKPTTEKKGEAFAVPVQILSGLAVRYPELVEEYNNTDFITNGGLDKDEILARFDKKLVDSEKIYWRTKVSDYGDLAKYTIGIFMKYPLQAIDIWAALDASVFHLPNNEYANIYSGDARGYLITGFKDEVYPDAKMKSKLPWLKDVVNQLVKDNGYQDNPVLYLIMDPAVYIWGLIFVFCYSIYKAMKKKKSILIIALMPMLLLATIILSPTMLIRYIYPIMITTVILSIEIIYNERAIR